MKLLFLFILFLISISIQNGCKSKATFNPNNSHSPNNSNNNNTVNIKDTNDSKYDSNPDFESDAKKEAGVKKEFDADQNISQRIDARSTQYTERVASATPTASSGCSRSTTHDTNCKTVIWSSQTSGKLQLGDPASLTSICLTGTGANITKNFEISAADYPNLKFIRLSGTGENNHIKVVTDIATAATVELSGTGEDNVFEIQSVHPVNANISGTGTRSKFVFNQTSSEAAPNNGICFMGTGKDTEIQAKINGNIKSGISFTGSMHANISTHGPVNSVTLISDSSVDLTMHGQSCPSVLLPSATCQQK